MFPHLCSCCLSSDSSIAVRLPVRGYDIYCGFDADGPGETASRQMITRHPSIQRRPTQHDCNDVLTARRQ